ncbi:RNA polymerase sigma factor [Planctomycetes bacterium Poly30]|uniref:RNA polymerase sigma factor n=1 Tax=Saltatorellus ferox TaxID=2528018 RepID=A0A518ENH2_9BACT|nr:RNA polymerase sigma factor [Planctomycetes bacterium Poly30]
MGHNRGSAIRIEELVEQRDWAVKLAHSLVGERGEPEALAQDALTAAWLRPPGDIRDLRAWLGALLRRRAATAFRATGRRAEHEAGAARTVDDEATDSVLIRADMHRRLVEHVLALPEPEARVLLRRYFDGQSPARIARDEGCAVSTIHNRLTRARQELRARLDRDGGHPHWMSALTPVPVRMVGRSAMVGAAPRMLAVGLKSALAAGFAVAAVLALVIVRAPEGGSEGSRPIATGGLTLMEALDPEQTLHGVATIGRPIAKPQREAIVVPEALARPDDGLFHGRLVERVGEELRPLKGDASIRLASSADVEIEAREGQPDELLLTSFLGDRSDEFLSVALEGEPCAVLDGAWSMPIPEADLVVMDVDHEGRRYRPVGSRVVPAGTATLTMQVERIRNGSLTVLDDRGRPITTGIDVRVAVEVPMGRRIRMTLMPFSIAVGGSSPPVAPDLHQPGQKAGWLARDASSPVAVLPSDYQRVLWVGKAGHQWEKLNWPVGSPSAEVTLRGMGGLEIEVLNRQEAGGLYQLYLVRGRENAAYWDSVRRNGIYRADGIGSGRHDLIVHRKRASRIKLVHRQPVDIVPGQVTQVMLDLASLVKESPEGEWVDLAPPAVSEEQVLELGLAELEVVEVPRGSVTETPFHEQLQWRHADDAPDPSATPFDTWNGTLSGPGKWTVRCAPGTVVLQVADSNGKPVGSAVAVQAASGFQRVEVEVDPAKTLALGFRIRNVPEEEYWDLVGELRRAFDRALLHSGSSDRPVLSFRQLTEGLGRQAVEGFVAVSEPGTLTLELAPERRERLPGLPRKIEIERGEPVTIRACWVDRSPR